MAELRQNPFKFGRPVEGDYFLAREGLENTVLQFLENRIHVALIGPRRFGKTSFVFHLLEGLKSRSYSYLFVDIFSITSHRDFLQQLVRAIEAKKGWKSLVKSWFRSVGTIRPKITADMDPGSGQPSFGLAIKSSSEKDVKEMIQDVRAHDIIKLILKVFLCILDPLLLLSVSLLYRI